MKNSKKWVYFFVYFCVSALLLGSSISLDAARKRKKTKYLYTSMHQDIAPIDHNAAGPETWVTVFLHGIMSIQPHLTVQNVMRFIRDDVHHTIYSKTVEYMRLDPYFYLNQAMQEFGLKKIDLNDLQPGHATNAIAHIYDDVTKMVYPHETNHYYTFGWSGLLSPTNRYADSIKLLESLTLELQEKYWKNGIFPKIRLVGYSHGGNVCLNVAAARRNVYPTSPISIDELILVGVPIQTETDYLVTDPIFKKIYHFFSQKDRCVVCDLFVRRSDKFSHKSMRCMRSF